MKTLHWFTQKSFFLNKWLSSYLNSCRKISEMQPSKYTQIKTKYVQSMFKLYRLIITDFLLGQQLAAIKGERKRCNGCRKVLKRHHIFNTTKSFCTVLVLSSICLLEKASGKTQELGDATGIIIMYFKNVLVSESKTRYWY